MKQFMSSMNRLLKTRSAVAIAVVCAFVATVAVGTFSFDAVSQAKKVSITLPEAKTDRPLDPKKLSDPLPANLFIELGKLLNPTVVSIFSSQTPRQGMGGGYRDPMQDLFEQFWGDPLGRPEPRGGGRQIPQATGLGTGFIVREDGLIITNNHVVAQADVIKVQLDNNSNVFYEAEVLGRDTRTDVAVIKIDAKRTLPVAQLGSSKDVQVGEWVAAFGNPYGHAHTMTKGIVSAIGRAIPELNRFPFIQTDASINPGNSGGPLVNARGLVIGVNAAIDARAQGIGFAIPIDDVKRVVAQLEKDGRIRRGFLGIGLAPLTPDVAAQLGLEDTDGIIVSQVMKGGPADKAGLKPYDIITEFNGRSIAAPGELQYAVGDSEVGTKVKVKAIRFDAQGKSRKDLNLEVTLTENPEDGRVNPMSEARPPEPGKAAPHDLGFKVADETSKLRQFYNIAPEAKGPIVVEVNPKGAAARVGLRAGDVILDVNRQAVSKASDVAGRLIKGRNLIRVARGNQIVLMVIGTSN